MSENNSVNRFHIVLLVSLFFVLVWSAIKPHDYFTWFLEVLPALLAVGISLFSIIVFDLQISFTQSFGCTASF